LFTEQGFQPCVQPPMWRTRSLYLCPPMTGWRSYTPRHPVPFSSRSTTFTRRCLATIGRFLPIRWLATIGGYTYTQTDGMIYEVRRWDGSVTMICISSFIKSGSDIRKLIGRIHRYTDSLEIT
jgi:hypothetical protein